MCSGLSCAVVGEWLLSLGLSFLIRETGRVEVVPAFRVLGGLNGTLAGCPACDGRPGVCALPACFLQGVRLPRRASSFSPTPGCVSPVTVGAGGMVAQLPTDEAQVSPQPSCTRASAQT